MQDYMEVPLQSDIPIAGFKKIIVTSLILMTIFTVYSAWDGALIFFVGILIMIGCLCVMDIPSLMLLSTVLAPNLMAIKLLDNATAFFGYFLLLVFAKDFFKRKRLSLFSLAPIVLAFCMLITVALYGDTSLMTIIIRCVCFFISIGVLFSDARFNSTEYREKLIQSYLIGLIFCVLFGFAYYVMQGRNIFNGSFAGIRNDRNYFSCLMSTGIAMGILYSTYNRKSGLIYKLSIPLLLFAGIISASRTFLLSMSFVLVLLIGIVGTKGKGKFAIQIILLLLICLILFGNYVFPALDVVLERFTDETVAGGNGRFETWEFYLNLTFSSITRALVGNGSATIYTSAGLVRFVEHNSFLQLISTIGLMGSTAMIACFWSIYKSIVKIKYRLKLQYLIPLFCTIFCYAGVSAMFSDNFNYSIMISFIIIDYCKRMSLLNHTK